jgi:hypothetical protein
MARTSDAVGPRQRRRVAAAELEPGAFLTDDKRLVEVTAIEDDGVFLTDVFGGGELHLSRGEVWRSWRQVDADTSFDAEDWIRAADRAAWKQVEPISA